MEFQAITFDEIEAFKPEMEKLKIRHISDMVDDLIKNMRDHPDKYLGLPVPTWPLFSTAFGGARGELVSITAETGVGKSTFARNWLFEMVNAGHRCLLVTLEDSMASVIRVMQQKITGQTLKNLTDDRVGLAIRWMKKNPLFYLDHHGTIGADLAIRVVEYAGQKLGVKMLVIDHLDYCVHRWDSRPEAYVVGDFVRSLSTQAIKHNMAIVLIVHPAKRGIKGQQIPEIGIDELKGSSAIKQESASIFALHKPDPEIPDIELRFLKIRCPEYGKYVKSKITFTMSTLTGCYAEQGSIEWK